MAVPFRIAALMVFFVFPICAFAQVPADNPLDEEATKVLAPITVTGSRIRRIDIEGPMPVLIFGRAEFESAGFNTLQEFMRKLPLNWGPQSDALHGATGRLGDASFNLRGLGDDATLTLVNGRRIAPYARGTGTAVDVNAIPLSAIDRIEVLKDGASAIYGAEAIAGVVNVILRDGYDGIEANAGYGVTEHGDNEELLADIVAGRDYGRGSLMAALSWYDSDPVLARERDWAGSSDWTDVGGPREGSPYGSPPTFGRYDTFQWEADPACGTDPVVSFVDEHSWGPGWGTTCYFDYNQYAGLITGIERLGATLSGRYEITGELSLFGDLLYSDVEAEHQMAPDPVIASSVFGTWIGYPFVSADHPDNPFGTDGELSSRPLDMGNRIMLSDAKAYRAVAGLQGAWRTWDWTAALFFTRSEVRRHSLNNVDYVRYQEALLGRGGAGGDQYYNPFGYLPQNDPALIDWIRTDTLDTGTNRMYGLDLDFNRFFGALPGGPVGLAAGLEFRQEELDQSFDEKILSGVVGGTVTPGMTPVSADRRVGSAFVEFSLPLHETLEAQLAARYDHFDDFGYSTNPKLALRWQPTPSLMLRSSYSTSFSPPSFGELFEPTYRGMRNFRDTVRCDITGLDQDCDPREYPYSVSGNPNLEPEEGTSWFVGTVWAPEFAPGLSVHLDWWKFEHENRIALLDLQTVLNEAGDFGIVREPAEPDGTPGPIIRMENTYVNFEKLRTEGFDTQIQYTWRTDGAGDFQASLLHTYTSRYEFTDSVNAWIEQHGNFAGDWAYIPLPRNRGNVNVSWSRGAHSAAANVRYVGHFRNFQNVWVDGEQTEQPLTVSSQTTLDLQYSYLFESLRGARLRIGCLNCSGEEPPFDYVAAPEAYHDPRGRVYYIRWQQPFR